MRLSCYLTVFLLASIPSILCAQVHVFDVRRPLPLTDHEIPTKDYYISGGKNLGLREGMIYTVTRRLPMHDPYQNRSQGDLNVPVARLRIIHVDDSSSVARFHSIPKEKEYPTLEYSTIMIGDGVDTGSGMEDRREPASEKSSKESIPSKGARASADSFTTIELKPIDIPAEALPSVIQENTVPTPK